MGRPPVPGRQHPPLTRSSWPWPVRPSWRSSSGPPRWSSAWSRTRSSRASPVRPFERAGTAALAEAVIGRTARCPGRLGSGARLGQPAVRAGPPASPAVRGRLSGGPQLRSLPEGLAERVMARVKGLDEPARETLQLLALFGSRVELHTLSAVTGEQADDLGRTRRARPRPLGRRGRSWPRSGLRGRPSADRRDDRTALARRGDGLSIVAWVGPCSTSAGSEKPPRTSAVPATSVTPSQSTRSRLLRQAEHRAAFREAFTLLSSFAELLRRRPTLARRRRYPRLAGRMGRRPSSRPPRGRRHPCAPDHGRGALERETNRLKGPR